MTEDDLQRVARFADYDHDRMRLGLLAALLRLPDATALDEILELLAQYAIASGWRLADLAADGPGDAQALRDALLALVGPLHPGRTTPEEAAAARFANTRTAWRAVMAAGAYPERLAAVVRVVGAGMTPLPFSWSPPPLAPRDDVPFAMQFGPHRLAMQGTSVTLDGETLTCAHADVAMIVYERNAREFEAQGLVGEPDVSAELPGVLASLYAMDDRSTFVFDGDHLTEATIYDADPAGYCDATAAGARREPRGLGAFSPAEQVPWGLQGIHFLRRVLAHPAGRAPFSLTLELGDNVVAPVLDWLAARPAAAYLETLHLHLPDSNQWGGIRAPARPLGALFPRLASLYTVYRSWPQWAEVPFPALENVTLYGAHQYDRPGDPYITPPLAEITADIAAKVRKLRSLRIG